MKGTKLYSILYNKCPRCHEGNFFIAPKAYDLRQFTKTNKSCPVCGEDFERETGFYYGAMYVSYGLTVGLGVAEFILTVLIFGFSSITFLILFSLSALALIPVTFRKARIIWINLFVKYKKGLKQ